MLAPHQEVVLRRLRGEREAECRIVGQIGGQSGVYVYGVAFLDPTVDLWGITFPPLEESEDTVGRALLECVACRNREVVHLDTMELEVFSIGQKISWHCKSCREVTTWRQAEHEPRTERTLRDDESAAVPVSPPVSAPNSRTTNERKYLRIACQMSVCVRQGGFQDEVATTCDISRGGFSFISPGHYHPGSYIQVAVPYSPSAANIFVAARVVYSTELKSEKLFKHGVMYSKGG